MRPVAVHASRDLPPAGANRFPDLGTEATKRNCGVAVCNEGEYDNHMLDLFWESFGCSSQGSNQKE